VLKKDKDLEVCIFLLFIITPSQELREELATGGVDLNDAGKTSKSNKTRHRFRCNYVGEYMPQSSELPGGRARGLSIKRESSCTAFITLTTDKATGY